MAKPAKERWGIKSVDCINEEVVSSIPKKNGRDQNIPVNTLRNQKNVWSQFRSFCAAREYELSAETGVEQIAIILQDWAFNMKKSDGEDYKESVVKVMWNIAAKMLQEKFSDEFQIDFNPFKDIVFKEARDARDAKRRELKVITGKRKLHAEGFTEEELNDVCGIWDEETPNGLQRKFYHLAATQLEWTGGEGAFVTLQHFIPEVDEWGNETGRIRYDANVGRMTPGSARSKWLVSNVRNPGQCPVRLFHKLKQHRPSKVKTNRLFLTPNRFWQQAESKGWFKNMPIGRNEIGKWTKQAAEKIGIDTKLRRITNRASTFRAGAPEVSTQQSVQAGSLGLRGPHVTIVVRPEVTQRELAQANTPDLVEEDFSDTDTPDLFEEDFSQADTPEVPEEGFSQADTLDILERDFVRADAERHLERANAPLVPERHLGPADVPIVSEPLLVKTEIPGFQEVKVEMPEGPKGRSTKVTEGENSIRTCSEDEDILELQRTCMVDDIPISIVSNQKFVCDSTQNILNILPASTAANLRGSSKTPTVVFNNCTFNIQSFDCNDFKK